jgi:hypothetical protein
MLELLLDSSMIGIVVLIIGTIMFNLTINKKNKDKNKPYGISLAFFMTGFITNLVLELGGFNEFMCGKRSRANFLCLSKTCKLNDI